MVRRRSTLVCYQGLVQGYGFLPSRVITPGSVGLHPNLVFLGLRPRPTTSLFHLPLTREGMKEYLRRRCARLVGSIVQQREWFARVQSATRKE